MKIEIRKGIRNIDIEFMKNDNCLADWKELGTNHD